MAGRFYYRAERVLYLDDIPPSTAEQNLYIPGRIFDGRTRSSGWESPTLEEAERLLANSTGLEYCEMARAFRNISIASDDAYNPLSQTFAMPSQPGRMAGQYFGTIGQPSDGQEQSRSLAVETTGDRIICRNCQYNMSNGRPTDNNCYHCEQINSGRPREPLRSTRNPFDDSNPYTSMAQITRYNPGILGRSRMLDELRRTSDPLPMYPYRPYLPAWQLQQQQQRQDHMSGYSYPSTDDNSAMQSGFPAHEGTRSTRDIWAVPPTRDSILYGNINDYSQSIRRRDHWRSITR